MNPHSFRMVVLADEILESFFETDFNSTFRLEPVPLEVPTSNPTVLGSLWSNIASDDNRKLLNIVTDQIGRTIGKHQACYLHACIDKADTGNWQRYRCTTDQPLGRSRRWRSRRPVNPCSRRRCGGLPRKRVSTLRCPTARLR